MKINLDFCPSEMSIQFNYFKYNNDTHTHLYNFIIEINNIGRVIIFF